MVSSTAKPVFVWHEDAQPPAGLPVTQVYGFLLDDLGRLVVSRDGERWNLPGGTPEVFDPDRVATLVREADEEVQVAIADPVYLGYQEARAPGRTPCAQLRMAARVTELAPRRPDPDKGRTLVRRVCPPREAVALLGWGPEVDEQVRAAVRTARTRWGLPDGTTAPAYTD